VRDIWGAALAGRYPFRIAELSVGALVVTHRTYTIQNERVVIPGHIGIITDLEEMRFLHASPSAGFVEEIPLRDVHAILGAIAVDS
jgi:hypothetical protein